MHGILKRPQVLALASDVIRLPVGVGPMPYKSQERLNLLLEKQPEGVIQAMIHSRGLQSTR